MVRSLLAIVVLLLCSNALADRHHLAKSWLAATTGDAVECRTNFADGKDLPVSLPSKSAAIFHPYAIAPIIAFQPQVVGPQVISGASPIRAPPHSL